MAERRLYYTMNISEETGLDWNVIGWLTFVSAFFSVFQFANLFLYARWTTEEVKIFKLFIFYSMLIKENI